MHSLARWLALAAICLQVAWPLLVNAKPRGVVLVPLCTVDGETHYLEQPAGKTPFEECYSHGSHCPFCSFDERVGLPAAAPIVFPLASAADVSPIFAAGAICEHTILLHGARAPPASPVLAASNDNNGRWNAKAISVRRPAAHAGDRNGFMRERVLLG